MTTPSTLRIHPAIGIARVGNAEDYVLAPETSAGMPDPATKDPANPSNNPGISGGLPISPDTDMHVSEQDLRGPAPDYKLKPHAQRFRIYAYPTTPDGTYPYEAPQGEEVQEVIVGSTLDGKTVESITWMVHVANKKANSWVIPETGVAELAGVEEANNGIGGQAHYYTGNNPDQAPNARNANFGTDKDPIIDDGSGSGAPLTFEEMGSAKRIKYLVLDAGPKVINSSNDSGSRIGFDAATPCQYIDPKTQTVAAAPNYPVQFPNADLGTLSQPLGQSLDTLGGMETDADGRLIVVGAPGYAAGWKQTKNNPGGDTPENAKDDYFDLGSDIDNDGWFDDASDGPVTALIHLSDSTTRMIENGAWVTCTDPSFAPQVRNIVTIWDEVYNAWLRSPELKLDTNIYTPGANAYEGNYNTSYKMNFEQDVWSIFRAAHLQMFTTGLNQKAIGSHQRISNIKFDDIPENYLKIKDYIRDPNTKQPNELQDGSPKMPLALGDTGASFLTVTETQYFSLNQWYAGKVSPEAETLSAGELLDKNTLTNLLGGRFSPGIDLTFIVRDPYLYRQDWKSPDIGPFRIAGKSIDYASVSADASPLTLGYIPNRTVENSVEPGDVSKFMALPWHTDYNSCATHQPSPVPTDSTTLFWSWPAQRPVSVYTYEDYQNNENSFYAKQRFSVRGTGTQWTSGETGEMANGPSSVGRYQKRIDILSNWFSIGVVMQGPAITTFSGSNPDLFLEVDSKLSGPSDVSEPWPVLTTDAVYPSKN